MHLSKLEVPSNITYFAAFMSMSCNLKCSYCINDLEQSARRDKIYPMTNKKSHVGLTPDQWIVALNRFPKNHSVPVTLSGGEPTIYYGDGLKDVVSGSDQYFDLLTNMGNMKFFEQVSKHANKFQRKSPYPSIRVSWHEDEMNRVWKGRGFQELVDRCLSLKQYGLDVTSDMSTSDVAIYMVGHPLNESPDESLWKGKIPYEVKEFLGEYEGKLYGTYAYPYSTNLITSGKYPVPLTCKCHTAEIICDPMGFIWSCHHHMYHVWTNGGLAKEFATMLMHEFRFTEYQDDVFSSWLRPLGHLLDPELDLTILGVPKICHSYGECSPCDVKAKQPHHKEGEEYTRQAVYSSVRITDIKHPPDFDKQQRKTIPIRQL